MQIEKIQNALLRPLIFTFSFLFLTKFLIDPDFGWHLATGEHFLKTGEVIRGDLFSWTMPGYVWENSYFLYQVTLAFIFNNFGHLATFLFFGFTAALAVFLLLPKKMNLQMAFFCILSTIIAFVNLGVRPHTISFLMLALLIIFLEKGYFKKMAHFFLWFVFFALWANFHRGFLAGILIFGTYLILEHLRTKNRRFPVYIVFSMVACVLGTFATPFGFGLYKSIILDLTNRQNFLWIAEWQPIGEIYPVNFVFAICGFMFIYLFLKNFAKSPVWFLIGASVFMFSFVSATFLSFWAVMFIFLLSRNLDTGPKLPSWRTTSVFVIFLIINLLAFIYFVKNFKAYSLSDLIIKDKYPKDALQFVSDNNLGDSLFNEYGWGGYIDWQAKDVKVFIDGRMTSWKNKAGKSIFGDYLAISMGNCSSAAGYGIRAILVKKDFDLACFGDYETVYEDDVAKVLVR